MAYGLLIILALFIPNYLTSQTTPVHTGKDAFYTRMNDFIAQYTTETKNIEQVRHRIEHSEIKGTLSDDEILAMAREEAKMTFLRENLDEYNRLFFPPAASFAPVVSICDNGGFEDSFTHYSGYTARYNKGSDSCDPQDTAGTAVTFVSATLPTTNRIEIVSSGTDPLVGISQTKFGSKALRLNNRYGHLSNCAGSRGVDRIEKEFTVTDSTRDFTIWYAVVLENPSGHSNSQPFFSITCDLASSSDLCFDADAIDCGDMYTDAICTFDTIIDVLDWACHRIKIPKSEIGEIATLVITAGDCGLSCHFGYAYVDGICEECTSSALGSIVLDSTELCDSTLAILCGEYTLPDVCGEDWSLDSLYVVDHEVDSIVIDTVLRTFCLYFPDSLFVGDTCYDVWVEVIFTNGSSTLPPVPSNSVELCDDDLVSYVGEITVGDCNDNSTDDNLSDDYYYVTVTIQNNSGGSWGIYQQLDDPYPDETGFREVGTGSGNGTIVLGPFFIQEGSWVLTVLAGGCTYEFDITPPEYCTECSEFDDIVINNVSCNSSGQSDTWSFDVKVAGSGNFYITGGPYSNTLKSRGSPISVSPPMSLLTECEKFTVTLSLMEPCVITFYVCPPKPCSNSCDIEPIIEEIICVSGPPETFNIQIDVDGVSGKYLCYKSQTLTGNPSAGASLPTNQLLTGFTEDIFLTIFLCDNANCNTNCSPTPSCFKTFYVPKPDYGCSEGFPVSDDNFNRLKSGSMVKIYPNPSDRKTLYADIETELIYYKIFDLTGNVMKLGQLSKGKQLIDFDVSAGIYYIFYLDDHGHRNFSKLIKL